MIFSQKSREGWLMIDHRASPGLPEDFCRATGLDPDQCKGGKIFEAATLTCSHCGIAAIKNPLRTRPREFCQKCHHFICDNCHAASQMPDYSHLPFDKLRDLVTTGKMDLGSPPSLLIPV